jgi:hypothetical protein
MRESILAFIVAVVIATACYAADTLRPRECRCDYGCACQFDKCLCAE